MEVKFAPSFFKSFKRYLNGDKWYNKIYNLFRYDIPIFFKNIKRFKKLLWEYRCWDYYHCLDAFKYSLIPLSNCIKNGNEVDEDRLPKYNSIIRTIEILNNVSNDNYMEQAENILNKQIYSSSEYIFSNTEEPFHIKENNKEIFDLSRKLEEDEWNELFKILKGDENIKGSNIKGWWD